jgi:hypothetical protein
MTRPKRILTCSGPKEKAAATFRRNCFIFFVEWNLRISNLAASDVEAINDFIVRYEAEINE